MIAYTLWVSTSEEVIKQLNGWIKIFNSAGEEVTDRHNYIQIGIMPDMRTHWLLTRDSGADVEEKHHTVFLDHQGAAYQQVEAIPYWCFNAFPTYH